MVLSFFVATTLSTILFSILSKVSLTSSLQNMILSSSIFFLGFVMLTEPASSPSTASKQTWYGALVGFLLPPQVHLFSFYTTPEIALVIGNVFSYLVSPKTKLFPVLRQKIKIAKDTAEFVFIPGRKLAYQPGQYMEWTLPHSKYDSRGVRRYFTLASSPTEPSLRIGVKFNDPGSSFKSALLEADEKSPFVASQLSGDFVMPKDTAKKLVFIAGGIGVTPYRSMVKFLLDMQQSRNITLLYSARTKSEFAYRDVFEQARQQLNLKVLYAVSNEQPTMSDQFMRTGRIDAVMIKSEIPDYQERLFYISGTHDMVKSMRQILAELAVPSSQIKTDFFPGYA
jgi:ferredoxin-NADP reductase